MEKVEEMRKKVDEKLNIDPNTPKCCFWFPLRCGMWIIWGLAIADLAYQIERNSTLFRYNSWLGVFAIVPTIAFFFVVGVFSKYVCFKDSYFSRKHMIVACTIAALANIWMLIVFLFGAIFVEAVGWGLFGGMVPTFLLPTIAWFYYRKIC